MLKPYTFLLLASAAACSARGPIPSPTGAPGSSQSRVVLDGEFGDWAGVAPLATRPPTGAAATAAELTAVRTRDDGRYVYFQIDLAHPINLLGFDGTMTLAVNADGDDATGATIDDLPGADLALDFSPRGANGRLTEGLVMRVIGPNGAVRTTDSYPLDVMSQPTYEASRFEMRVARGRMLDSSRAWRTFANGSYRAQFVVRDPSGNVTNRLAPISARLSPLDTTLAIATTDPLARAPNTRFRALVWNVANEGILERPDHFRRVLNAINPDLLVLDEVAGAAGRERVRQFLATVEPSRGAWNFTYGRAGGYQRTVIASHSPVTEFPELAFVPFDDSFSSRWLSLVPEARRGRERDSLVIGLASGGALVEMDGKRLAVFGVDLQSAGNRRTSWQDTRRRVEAEMIRDHAIAAIRAHGPIDAVIEAGDHNLVGTRDPLEILAGIGSAFDGAPLSHAYLLQLDGETTATWTGSGGAFPPGRLDWFNYSASRLEVVGGFIFDVEDLGERWRIAHGLQADDSRRSSDHRPVVVDLRWR